MVAIIIKWANDDEGLKDYGPFWHTPKFLVGPTWGSKCVGLRKVGTWEPLPTSSTKEG
jgi:hypothetical protein